MTWFRKALSTRPTRRRASLDWGAASASACLPLEPRLLPSASVFDVLTYHNDNLRTGLNANEYLLTTANVNAQTFGKVGQAKVDGQVYAQPLYKVGVPIPGRGTRDVVFVATAHDSVYALDAHSLAGLWKTSFINPARGITTIPTSVYPSDNLGLEIGILGTPVIDAATNTLYVVARTREVSGAAVRYV